MTMRPGSPPPLGGRKTNRPIKRKTRPSRRLPAGHPALDDGRDERPQNVMSAYVCDPGRSMAFTGETVGNSTHKMGPTTWARQAHGQVQVSTLTDHVSTDKSKRIPNKPQPVTVYNVND